MLTLSSSDLGSPTEPGIYKAGDAIVQVDRQHLEVWRDSPDTVFRTILCTRANDNRLRLVLGASVDNGADGV